MLAGEHRKKLKSLCKTRWVERHEAFEVFVDLFEPLVCCMEDIKDLSEWNHDSRADAQSLFLALTQFPFIVALVVTKDILAYTKPLSVKLQGRYVDIVRAYGQIKIIETTLKDARRGIENCHSLIYAKAVQVATKVHVSESLPRTAGRQLHRNNVIASTASEYYKQTLTIPMLDHLISEMEERFQYGSSSVISEMKLLLPSILAQSRENVKLTSSDIPNLVSLYGEDLPALASLDSELHCWSVKWKDPSQCGTLLSTPAKTLAAITSDFFPNIDQLLKIICTLGVTSAECKRSISRLRYLKSYLHSTMTETRLNGLAMLFVHRDISCNATAVVDEFTLLHPRCLLLVNPLDNDQYIMISYLS